MDLKHVLTFLDAAQDRGQATVLVTVCAVDGSSMRNPGTIMGVCEDGTFAGSLSGGCIENAVVAEALDVLAEGTPRMMRFGAGSPYIDIKLPCGGGLDLHFCPLVGKNFVEQCLNSVAARAPFSIATERDGVQHHTGWQEHAFDAAAMHGIFGQWPAPLLQIIGHGAGVEALSRLALTYGCMVRAITPDERIIEALSDTLVDTHRLSRISQTDLLSSDAWTATIFLFHDHDWEIELLQRAFDLPHFYLGAMGGRKAHAMRTEVLLSKGVSQDQLDQMRAPIGLFHSSRDPQTLALSTLGEVIRAYHDTDFEAFLG